MHQIRYFALFLFWVAGWVGAEVVHADSLTVAMDLPVLTVSEAGGYVEIGGGEGMTVSGEPGKPRLPQKWVTYAVPPDADMTSITVRIDDLQYSERSVDHPVRPCPPWRTAEDSAEFYGTATNISGGRDMGVYGVDADYPASPVSFGGVSQMRRWKLLRVAVCPVLYNPVRGTLKHITKVNFTISYDREAIRKASALDTDTVMDAQALGLVANAVEARSWYSGAGTVNKRGGATGDVLVIMTTDAIFSESTNLFGLVSHKAALGYGVHTVTETKFDGEASATGWNEVTGQSPDGKADRMRKWLQDRYVSMGIRFVLLIGNPDPAANELPMKELFHQAYVYPVDCYYSDLTGNWDIDGNGVYGSETNDVELPGGVDMTPEIYVGRIPVYPSDPQWRGILRGIIHKIIRYELESDLGWRRAGLLPESFSNLETDGGWLGYHTENNILMPKGSSAYTLYEQGSVSTNYDSVLSSDEELLDNATVKRWMTHPYGMVLWWAHGWSRGAVIYAGGEVFESAQCPMLDDERPAVLFMASCSCGEPSDSQNLSYAMLRDGGIASVAAGQVSWFYSCQWSTLDAKGMNASMGYDFMRKVVSNEMTFGQALAEVKSEANGWWNNRFTFSLYGDPTLSIASPGTDSDSDGLPDVWESQHGLSIGAADGGGNPDGDGYSNLEEYRAGLDPQTADSPASTYASIAVAGTFNGWNPAASNLALVADYTWQGILTLTNASGVEYKFTANGGWAANWGDNDPLFTNANMAGVGEAGGANIPAGSGVDGRIRFTFHELTGGYRIEPAPEIDTDLDGMPDEWEVDQGLNPLVHDAAGNPDHDVYTNLEEYQNGTNPSVYNAPQSSYSAMCVAGTFNGWAPALTNMCLVDDHTWRGDITFTNQGAVEFKFAANGNWTANWGDDDPTQTAVPLAGIGEYGGENIAVTSTFDGPYRFTFQDQTLAYSLAAIATPDTDNDGMDDDWERNHGLSPKDALDAWGDADGDGLTQGEEYALNGDPALDDTDGDGARDFDESVAGTLLNDTNSILAAFVESTGTSPELSWPGMTGRTYTVFYATNMFQPTLQPMSGYSNMPCLVPGTMSLTIPDLSVGCHFFGIQVRKE